MDVANEILDAIEIIVDKKIRENTAQIYPGVCKSVSGNTCVVSINGKDNTVRFYGSTPSVDSIYRVFVPNGNMSMAFVITGGGSGGGSSPSGVTSYKELTDLPSINGVILQEGATSKSLSLYGSGNEPNYPVTKVNGKTGEVILTASDVGAAPAGYGLGTNAVPIDDYNNAVSNGWYSGGTNYPSKISYANYGMVRVDSVGQIKLQTFYAGDTGSAITAPFMAIRKSGDYGATWSEWEYVNPPMVIGVEYRTTERHMGKPVYVKLVDFGAGANNTEKSVEHGASNAMIIDYGGYAKIGNGALSVPWMSHSTLSVSSTIITMTADANYSRYNVYVWIKYYKTTD